LSYFYWGGISDPDIEEIFVKDIQEKTRLVKKAHGVTPLVFGSKFLPRRGFYTFRLFPPIKTKD